MLEIWRYRPYVLVRRLPPVVEDMCSAVGDDQVDVFCAAGSDHFEAVVGGELDGV